MLTFALLLTALVLAAFALWWRRGSARDRQRLEDALKHLFEQEYRGRHASLSSLAGRSAFRRAAVVNWSAACRRKSSSSRTGRSSI